MVKSIKTEHSGAKNGGGYWGTRAAAKRRSKKRRRLVDKQTTKILINQARKLQLSLLCLRPQPSSELSRPVIAGDC